MDELLRLPLSERISHVLRRTARFYASGVEVDGKEALAAVRSARVGSH